MEIKEHMPWIASMLTTAVACVAARHRAMLLSDASLRTTAAAVLWLVAWAVLHYRWRGRQIDAARIDMWTLILMGLGVLATFPPLWRLL